MMKQCEKCIFYDKNLDEMHQSDALVEDEEEKEVHCCIQYMEGIPEWIASDEKECSLKQS